MAVKGVSTPAVFAAGAGALFLWSGIGGKGVSRNLRSLLSAKPHLDRTTVNPIAASAGGAAYVNQGGGTVTPGSSGSTGDSPVSASANRSLGALLASTYGWGPGTQDWQALDYGWGTLESGWNNHAENGNGGAFGIPQAYTHGTASTAGTIVINGHTHNQYGPINGMTLGNSTYVGANNGNAYDQIVWGLAYIKLTYGAPHLVPGWLGGSGYGGY